MAEVDTKTSTNPQSEVYTRNIPWPLAPWQTRLIKLLPGLPDSRLVCELHVADIILDEGFGLTGKYRVQSFEALSYSWGTYDRTERISCNGILTDIPPGLAEALEGLRLPVDDRWLWCDAICINQADPQEKSAQVRKLAQIFGKATRVVAWLGKSDADLTYLFEMLTSYCSWKKPDKAVQTRIAQALCAIPWFRRTWVRQEVWASQDLILKSAIYETPFTTFATMAKDLVDTPAHIQGLMQDFGGRPAGISKSNEIERPSNIRAKNRCDDLRGLLYSGGSFDISDDRDRIYALIGMTSGAYTLPRINRGFRALIEPDYGKSLSQVYQDVVKYCINVDENLTCLEDFMPTELSSDLPSWTVDWRPGKSVNSSSSNRHAYGHGLTEFGQIPISPPSTRLGTLSLTGVILGFAGPYAPIPTFENVAVTIKKEVDSRSPHHHRMSLMISSTGMDRCLLAGCFVPAHTREGDVFVLLRGSQRPFVLRPSATADGTLEYQWIGASDFWYYHLGELSGGNGAKRLHPSLKTLTPKLEWFRIESFSWWLGLVWRSIPLQAQLLDVMAKRAPNYQPVDVVTQGWLHHLDRMPSGYRCLSHETWHVPPRQGKGRDFIPDPLPEQDFLIV